MVGSVRGSMAGETRITHRDVEILAWMGRHGVVTPQQIGRRFFEHDDRVAQKRAYRRLGKLEELGLIRRDAPFARHPEVLRLRSRGVTLAQSDLPPARFVLREISHELAVVDLVEDLLRENAGSTLWTGREVRRLRTAQRLEGTRRVGRGRTPDAVLRLESGIAVAVELQLVPRRTRDDLTVLEGYIQERFDRVWWYVPEAAVERVRKLVRDRQADDLVEVRSGPGPATAQPEVTERDVEVLGWVGRYGMATAAQVARRFFGQGGGSGMRSARNRLSRLQALGVLRSDIPSARHPAVFRLTAEGAELTDAYIAPAGWVPAEIGHSLGVLDIMELLVGEHPGSSIRTEREIRARRGATGRGRSIGTDGRIPDGELHLPSGQRVAVELDLTPKRSPDVAKIIRSYQRADYDGVWWFVRPAVVDRMTSIVEDIGASRLIEVHGWDP
jgi:hypothetical protein